MHFGNLRRGELISIVGGAILAVAVFLAWYKLKNPYAKLNHFGPRKAGLELTAWEALQIIRFGLLAAAVAPLILAYIILRDHALSWPRGELTAVVALTAFTLILVRGVIIKPGTPTGEISLQFGWFVALAGSILMMVGAVTRSSESGKARKPPGVL
jgi:hypothetical protein